MRLLAKDPNERPESAADVLTALESIDLTPLESPLTKGGNRGVQDANVLDSLAGGVFVGRQAEMGQLKAALEDALGGKGLLAECDVRRRVDRPAGGAIELDRYVVGHAVRVRHAPLGRAACCDSASSPTAASTSASTSPSNWSATPRRDRDRRR